jgi:hypothetical protein
MFAHLSGIDCGACPHVLQTHDDSDVRRLETCMHALGTGEPCCTGQPTSPFFIIEAHGPEGTARRVVARSPPCREAGSEAIGHVARRCHGTHGGSRALPIRGALQSRWTHGSLKAHLGWEAGSGAAGHVTERGCMPRSLS